MKNRSFAGPFLCLVFSAISWFSSLSAQPKPAVFERINQLQFGFSEMDVHDIIQDQQGFLWIATKKGLIRHDGHELMVFRENPNAPSSISDNSIQVLVEDTDSTLWIGTTSEGLSHYDPVRNAFTHFYHNANDSSSLSNNEIKELLVDSKGRLWVGTRVGLDLLDRQSGTFIHYRHTPGDSLSLSRNDINCLAEDNQERIWVGTYGGGLNCLDPETGKVIRFTTTSQPARRIADNTIIDIEAGPDGYLWFSSGAPLLNRINPSTMGLSTFAPHKEQVDDKFAACFWDIWPNQDGTLWLGTHAAGLLHYAPESDLTTSYRYEPTAAGTIAGDIITSLWLDNAGDLWTGHKGPGWSRLSTQKTGFEILPIFIQKDGKSVFPAFRAVTEDEQKKIWAGTWGHGLCYYDPTTGETTVFTHEQGNEQGLAHNIVWDVLRDRKNFIWLATHGGLQRIDPIEKRFKTYRTASGKTDIAVRSLLEDHTGKLWVGTFEGLYWLDPATDMLHLMDTIPNNASFAVWELFEDGSSHLWVSMLNQGVYRLDLRTGKLVHFKKMRNRPDGLTSNKVNTIVEDSQQRIWLSTTGGGLNLFVPNTENPDFSTFQHWRPYNTPAIDENILHLSVDHHDQLWMTTDKGLLSFDTENKTVKPHELNGLIKGLNVEGRSGHGGLQYVGNAQYIYRFHPDSIGQSTLVPPVFITDLQIGGRSIPIRGTYGDSLEYSSPLEKSIFYTESIQLKYWQNDLTFVFTALNYRQSENNRYRYQLEGFDKTPSETGALHRYVRYTNLSPGNYTFRVTASNNENFWNEKGKSLHLRIAPPWWQTTLAYILWIILIGGVIYAMYNYQLKRKLALVEAKRLQEMDTLKTHLYTNITHEFRTPLTVILGMADQLKEQVTEAGKIGLRMIGRNGRQLLNLVNQMLDLAKLESNAIQLELIQDDVITHLKYLTESFQSYVENKNIRLHFSSEEKELLMDFDPARLQQVVSNLLSNAIKFTPDGGDVYFWVKRQTTSRNLLVLQIKDTGIGIPEGKVPYIFDRFYQADDSTTRMEGTGIGLAITQELVKLMQGTIRVDSTAGEGSVFTVVLPITRTAKRQTALPMQETPFAETIPFEEKEAQALATFAANEVATILLVEDNHDVITYLMSCLHSSYHLEVAYDGEQGIQKALEHIPDLIISDVMMPKKDGFMVCDNLKTDERTSHIPIILLTAKADIVSKLTGLSKGADAYLAKPFHKKELLVRIQSLLETRRRIQQHYLAQENLSARQAILPLTTSTSETDKTELEFIKKVRSLVEDNLTDFDFSVARLALLVHYSEPQLYRKIKGVTGLSPSKFIRSIKVARAKALLRDPAKSIAAVAFDAGFKDPEYFAKVFKQETDMKPTEYRRMI